MLFQAPFFVLAGTPLVKNLDNQEYLKILLNGKASLEELFAQLEMSSAGLFATQQSDVERILPGYQKLKKEACLPDQIMQLLSVAEFSPKSN